MSLESTTSTIKDRVGEDCGLGAKLKFDCGDDGVVMLDAESIPNVVNNDDGDAACTIKISLDDLDAMMSGDLDPMAAFSLGKLQLEGDMSIAMKLGSLLR
jgi:putative sterol carrier protein